MPDKNGTPTDVASLAKWFETKQGQYMGMSITGGVLAGLAGWQQESNQLALERMQAGFDRMQIQQTSNKLAAQSRAVQSDRLTQSWQVGMQGLKAQGQIEAQQGATASTVGDLMQAVQMQEAMQQQVITDKANQQQFNIALNQQANMAKLNEINTIQKWNESNQTGLFESVFTGAAQAGLSAYTQSLLLDL